MDSLVNNLKLIASIKPGDKLNSSQPIGISRGWLSGIYRFIYGESRKNTLQFLDTTILKLQLMDSKIDPELLPQVINGLEALIYSYRDDIEMTKAIQSKIASIQNIMQEIKSSNPQTISLRHSV